MQGCELCRHRAAVRLCFRRRDRKRILRVWKLLHHHQARASTGESVVRVWQGHRELASTGESRQTLKRYTHSPFKYSLITANTDIAIRAA